MTETNYNVLLENVSNSEKRKLEESYQNSRKLPRTDFRSDQKEKNLLMLLKLWFSPELEKENYIDVDVSTAISIAENKKQASINQEIETNIQPMPERIETIRTDNLPFETVKYNSCSTETLQKDQSHSENTPNNMTLLPINSSSSQKKIIDRPEVVKSNDETHLQTFNNGKHSKTQNQNISLDSVSLEISRWENLLKVNEKDVLKSNIPKPSGIVVSFSENNKQDMFAESAENRVAQRITDSFTNKYTQSVNMYYPMQKIPEETNYQKANFTNIKKLDKTQDLNRSVDSIASLGISKLIKYLEQESNDDLDVNKHQNIASTNRTSEIAKSSPDYNMTNIFVEATEKNVVQPACKKNIAIPKNSVHPLKQVPDASKKQDLDFFVCSTSSSDISTLIDYPEQEKNDDLDSQKLESTMSTYGIPKRSTLEESFFKDNISDRIIKVSEDSIMKQIIPNQSCTEISNTAANKSCIKNPHVGRNKRKKNSLKILEATLSNNLRCSQTSHASLSSSSANTQPSCERTDPAQHFENKNIDCSQTSHISLSSNYDVQHHMHVLSTLSTNISLFPNGFRKFQNIHKLSNNLNWLTTTLPIIQENQKRSLLLKVYPIFNHSSSSLTQKSAKFHEKLSRVDISHELTPIEKMLEDKIDQNLNKPLLKHYFNTPDQIPPQKVIQNIHFILGQFYDIFQNGGFASIQSWNTSCRNSVFKNNMYILKPQIELILRTIKSPNIICCIMFLLSKVCVLLESNTKITLRELFYLLKCIFKSPSIVSNAVDELSRLLGIGPWHLNICTHNGLVHGDLKLMEQEKITHCNSSPVIIPFNIDEITEMESSAHFILVVEKEAIFMKLLEENLLSKLGRPFIILTGKGVPSYNTRLFLHKLAEILQIPVFILTDPDVYGIKIMMIYRFGCFRSCHLSQYLTVPNAQWLGILPSEINRFGLPRLKISQREKNILNKLIKDYHELEPEYPQLFQEFNIQLSTGDKASIEGMIKSDNFLSQVYLPTKLIQDDFF